MLGVLRPSLIFALTSSERNSSGHPPQGRPILAALVNVIKELASKLNETTRPVNALTAHRVEADRLYARDQTGAATCVTKSQLDAPSSGGALPRFSPRFQSR